jgi:antitoxin ParD1/3/4
MNVSLTPELEKRIEEKVSGGLYGSASELVREALRLFFDVDERRRREAAELDELIRIGIEQLDRGESIPGDEARRRSLARLRQRIRKRA